MGGTGKPKDPSGNSTQQSKKGAPDTQTPQHADIPVLVYHAARQTKHTHTKEGEERKEGPALVYKVARQTPHTTTTEERPTNRPDQETDPKGAHARGGEG